MAEIGIKLNDLTVGDKKNLVGTSGEPKIQIVQQAQPKTLSKLPSRPAVELAFTNLAYRVKEGRSNSKFGISNIFRSKDSWENVHIIHNGNFSDDYFLNKF